jgi:hypothetical protein
METHALRECCVTIEIVTFVGVYLLTDWLNRAWDAAFPGTRIFVEKTSGPEDSLDGVIPSGAGLSAGRFGRAPHGLGLKMSRPMKELF